MLSLPLPIAEEQVPPLIELERRRLYTQAGLERRGRQPFKRPRERRFTRAERDRTTLLFGGLTRVHEQLILAGLEGLGYQAAVLPTPQKADFQAGKEYGNNGQCNPTYFTVGALVNYLKDLRDNQGLSPEDILQRYVFFTAGACGPCRFGMYEAEFRLALRNSGFDGFRVVLFQQKGGLEQAALQAGLEFNLSFFLTLLNALFIGDVLNELAYQIRSYEIVPGQTDRVLQRCVQHMQGAFRNHRQARAGSRQVASLLARLASWSSADDTDHFLDQLRRTDYHHHLRTCLQWIQEDIEVDFTSPKPLCKITGEFWAQTTEGDGNFRMFRFLEDQGAEVLVEPVATWIMYLINQAAVHTRDTEGLINGAPIPRRHLRRRLAHALGCRKKRLGLYLARRMARREYNRYRKALGGTTHQLIDQPALQRLGHPYYHSRAGGGEGHLEVAKNIYYTHHALAHAVFSLKPFGCMPSTQSDGAQAAVVNRYPDMIYIPIETAGEGTISAHSRVQMALGEAKHKCRTEFNRTLRRTGYSLEQIQRYVAQHRELRRPVQQLPHYHGVIGKAARFCLYVAQRMDRHRNWSMTCERP